MRFLEEEGAKPSLFGAAFQGDLERIKEVLEEGVDIDLKGRYRRTAFVEAHLRGHFAAACSGHNESALGALGGGLPHPARLQPRDAVRGRGAGPS